MPAPNMWKQLFALGHVDHIDGVYCYMTCNAPGIPGKALNFEVDF